MGQNLKVSMQGGLIVLSFAILLAWQEAQPGQVAWTLRLSLPPVAFAIAGILYRESRKKEVLKDMLAEISLRYFERDGLCFTFVPQVHEGICWISVFFQSRYERPCEARLVMRPEHWATLGGRPIAPIDVDVAVEGGSFGVLRFPVAVPLVVQGVVIHCDVLASVSYPSGRGKLLRLRHGLHVGEPGPVSTGRLLLGLLRVASGTIGVTHPARISLQMPKPVADVLPEGLEMESQLIWVPEPPTGGFPVENEK
jgi:hypothetical protein